MHAPSGFIPAQDKGYLLVNVQLPDAASVERTADVMRRIETIADRSKKCGVKHTVAIAGQSLKMRSDRDAMAPLSAVMDVEAVSGPVMIVRYNMYPAAPINGTPSPGISSGQALTEMNGLAGTQLPSAMHAAWTELAMLQHENGNPPYEATLAACRLRLRPIMMTSFAFIFEVVPLAVSQGAGAEMRRTLGAAVFSGMLGVTLFGIFLPPFFTMSSNCGMTARMAGS